MFGWDVAWFDNRKHDARLTVQNKTCLDKNIGGCDTFSPENACLKRRAAMLNIGLAKLYSDSHRFLKM